METCSEKTVYDSPILAKISCIDKKPMPGEDLRKLTNERLFVELGSGEIETSKSLS